MAITGSQSSARTASAPPSNYTSALVVVTTLFFMWGFLTALNDILVPHLKSIFDFTYAKVILIQFAFFSAYFVFSIPAGKIVDAIGYKRTMVLGLLVMALGAILFVPAASVPSFPMFLGALIVLAAGITALQVAANPYVAVLGPPQTASSRLNLTQAFNSLGTTIAPALGGLFILSAAPKTVDEMRQLSGAALQAYRVHEASSVKLPYLGLSLALVVLAVVIAKFNLPTIPAVEHKAGGVPASDVLKYRHLLLGAIGIFVYVGAEVSIGSFLISYLTQPDIGNISQKEAATLVGFFYWGGAMVGRFLGAAILQRVRTGLALGVAAMAASSLVVVSMISTGHVAMWSIILVGLFNSIMFPSIFTLGIAELGPLTGDGSGVLIMAIVGGALIPFLEGSLADHIGLHRAFIIPMICYLYIVYYGFKGIEACSDFIISIHELRRQSDEQASRAFHRRSQYPRWKV